SCTAQPSRLLRREPRDPRPDQRGGTQQRLAPDLHHDQPPSPGAALSLESAAGQVGQGRPGTQQHDRGARSPRRRPPGRNPAGTSDEKARRRAADGCQRIRRLSQPPAHTARFSSYTRPPIIRRNPECLPRNAMTDRIACHGLQVAPVLHQFVEQEALAGTGIQADAFWKGLSEMVRDLTPKNRALLAERDRLQAALDEWYGKHPGPIADPAAYRAFLKEIGYLKDAPEKVAVTTANVDT